MLCLVVPEQIVLLVKGEGGASIVVDNLIGFAAGGQIFLGAEDGGQDILFRIIDKRYQANKAVIVTSNVALAELDFDDRVVDRLNAMTVTVKIPEVCIRAREANTKKRAIMQKLGIE